MELLRKCYWLFCALIVGAGGALAMADGNTAQIVTRHHGISSATAKVIEIANPDRRRTGFVPAEHARAELKGLIEVQVTGSLIYIDPNENYIHQGWNPIDENHHIPRVQALYRNLNGNKWTTIYGPKHVEKADEQPVSAKPKFIIMSPGLAPAGSKKLTPKKIDPKAPVPIPNVPAPKKKDKGSMLIALAN